MHTPLRYTHNNIHSASFCCVSPKCDKCEDAPAQRCKEQQQQQEKEKNEWKPLILHTPKAELTVGERTQQQITSKFFVQAEPRKQKH